MTGKVGFFTNHYSSEYIFPRDRPATAAVNDDTPSSDAPAGSHSAVEESADLGYDDDDLAWEGFMSSVENQPNEEATSELIVGSVNGGDRNDDDEANKDKDTADDDVEDPEMGECCCGFPGIIGLRCEHCGGFFITISGQCVKCGTCSRSS